MIYAIIYIIGFVIAAVLMPMICPYKDGSFKIIDGYAVPISREEWKIDNAARAFVWPIALAAVILLLPCVLISAFCDMCYDIFNKE